MLSVTEIIEGLHAPVLGSISEETPSTPVSHWREGRYFFWATRKRAKYLGTIQDKYETYNDMESSQEFTLAVSAYLSRKLGMKVTCYHQGFSNVVDYIVRDRDNKLVTKGDCKLVKEREFFGKKIWRIVTSSSQKRELGSSGFYLCVVKNQARKKLDVYYLPTGKLQPELPLPNVVESIERKRAIKFGMKFAKFLQPRGTLKVVTPTITV